VNPENNSSCETHLSRRGWLATAAGLALPATVMVSISPEGRAEEPKAVPAADKERVEKFMRRAMELAKKGVAAGDGGPFAAVVVRGDEIVGEGWNHVVSHNDPTAHGEVVAIRDAGAKAKTFDLKECEIYTTGDPCPMCLCAIYWARIEKIYYGFTIAQSATVGFDDQPFFEQINLPVEKRKVPALRVLGDENFAMLKDYAANPKRVKY
jgi:guanine deaminase